MWDKLKELGNGVKTNIECIIGDLRDTFDSWHDAGWTLGYVMLALVIALTVAVPAYADDRVLVHTVSDHSTAGPHVERNWGIGVELQAEPRSTCDQYVGGTYRNSNGDVSLYAMCDWTLAQAGLVELHGLIGAATGYGDLTPVAGLTTRVDMPGPVDPDIFVMPLRERDGGIGMVGLLNLTATL